MRHPIALHPPCESSFAGVGQPHSILLYCTVPNLAARARLSTAATSSLAGGWASSSEAGQVYEKVGGSAAVLRGSWLYDEQGRPVLVDILYSSMHERCSHDA